MAKKQEECPAGAPLWMVTFSDLVTLLLTFFVLLLSMATMDKVKFDEAKQSLEQAFGFHSFSTTSRYTVPVMPSAPKSKFAPIPQPSAAKYYKRIKTDIEMTKISDKVEVIKRDDNTIVLRINDAVLFEPGKATLNPASYPLLRKIADIVRPLPMTMRIEGHTDNTPIAGKKITNWDLSVARAISVMRFYNRGKLFSLDRMSAVGYGDTRPIAPNDSPENKEKNRRVDFVLHPDIMSANAKAAPPIPL
ncbi:chemotaxis protein MotB [Desulfolithobacter dissulfuricans]|uniref:Chemotaxis protein MotB n=1 Tax=Desulfolithobacter dissulfuricans TaxID=2795293 RepID=A0A915U9M9_9BACT|nr:flagellar motor protein MotB [Desulfolithobacter dissulfuricans]BCO08540.1 chemotaxis protein MotB [Desulfolithobacter dissulfuricans]